ncbi:MAG: RIP metalloprotease RseP [Clostridiaceae bacterium]
MTFTTVLYILIALVFFGILILGHEFGHFILAKINGVLVEEFSIGMGPKLFSIKGKETVYSIRALPIGGYVKMLGEQEKVDNERAFTNLSKPRRLSIIAAGPLMNLVLAILFFALYGGNIGVQTNIIDSVIDNSPAYEAKLEAGDEIIRINDTKINTFEGFITEIGESNGEPLNIVVSRNGENINLELTPEKAEDDRYVIGVYTKLADRGFASSLSYGFKTTGFMFQQTFKFFGTLFQGKVKASDFGGPVSIFRISSAAAAAGIWNLVYLMGAFSVQLAIFNIIPFPALDGGYIFLYIFEIITGKEVDDNKIGMINYFGFIFLMILMVLVTIKDILYPIKF